MSSSSEGSLDYDCYRIEPFLIARNAIFSDYPQTDSPIGTRDSFIRGKTPVLMTELIWSPQFYHTTCASVVPETLMKSCHTCHAHFPILRHKPPGHVSLSQYYASVREFIQQEFPPDYRQYFCEEVREVSLGVFLRNSTCATGYCLSANMICDVVVLFLELRLWYRSVFIICFIVAEYVGWPVDRHSEHSQFVS